MGLARQCAGLPGAPCIRITSNRRCPDCARKNEASRDRADYGWSWQQIQKQAIREHPWCVDCGTGGTPDNPLTGDHIVPRVLGGKDERANVAVRCRTCNSRKGARQTIGGGVEK
jgi:5-methylcytosine-specific restriction endonuclease McrA